MDLREVPLAGDSYIDSLVFGHAWSSSSLTFGFPSTTVQFTGYSGGEPYTGFNPLTSVQQAATRTILASISSFANVVFSEITGANVGTAVLRFGLTTDADPAHAYLPSASELGGDAWFSNDGTFNNVTKGGYGFFGLMHEIGHTLGLTHPHEPEQGDVMPADRDWMAYTVMSYRSYEGAGLGYYNEDWGFAQSYMLEDIAALQHIYGANYNSNVGNTTYYWNPSTGEMSINGVGQGAPGANRIFMTMWDGGGEDTYDFSGYSSTVVVDLRPGAWTWLGNAQQAQLGGDLPPGEIANAYLIDGDIRALIEQAVGGAGDDVLFGNDTHNYLVGGAGRDRLEGFLGDDTLHGADGDDELRGHEGNDRLYGGAGGDLLYGYEGNDFLGGGDGGDWLNGDAGDDTLEGGAGDDTLTGGSGSDYFIGGTGNDVYYFTDAGDHLLELPGGGIDRVETPFDFSAAAGGVENITLTGSAPINATGNELANTINGNEAANVIDGGAGADTMAGFLGDDSYYVDDPNDKISELASGGMDTVYSSIDFAFTVAAPPPGNYDPYAGASLRYDVPVNSSGIIEYELENLILTGSANPEGIGNGKTNTIRGNVGNNPIDGMGGNDIIIGGLGADELTGGLGADLFVYEATADSTATQMDWLKAFEYGADLIDLRLIDVTGIVFQLFGELSDPAHYTIATVDADEGPDLVIKIDGAAAEDSFLFNETQVPGTDDVLTGTGGPDELNGGNGNDTLIGLGGSDRLIGGYGDDHFYVDSEGDLVVELFGQGNDRVVASVSYFLTAAAKAERLECITLTSTNAINLGGSDSPNTIYGNYGTNILYGMGGGDILWGFDGDDYLVGGTGADALWGGLGNDTFYVDQANDRIYELAGEGFDRVAPSVNFTLPDSAEVELVEAITLSATNALNLGGSDYANTIYGNNGINILHGHGGNDVLYGFAGNDFLAGDAGNDAMIGGLGDDTYYVDSPGDLIYELAGEGYDRVAAAISLTLPDNAEIELLESVTLGATTAMNLAGSNLANTIGGNNGVNILRGYGGNDTLYGYGGDDYLDGGAGDDTMVGGTGADTYYIDSAGDVIVDAGYIVGGLDRVATSVSYTLPEGADIEIFEPINTAGTDPLAFIGNDGHGWWISGNNGDNLIDGRGGEDRLTGGGGADTFRFSTALGGWNVDTIFDFQVGIDKIAIDNAIFTWYNPGSLDPATFRVGTAAQDADDFIIYDSVTGHLYFDADGNGSGSQVQFAFMQGAPTLGASDFIVV